MAFKYYLLTPLLLVLISIQSHATPEVFLDTPAIITAYKGQNIELRCFVSTSNINTTEFDWILPEVEEYIEEDRKKRIELEIYSFSKHEDTKVVKLKIPTIKYQDRGEYLCRAQSKVDDFTKVKKTLIVVQEPSGFTPAIWILVGFLAMTICSVGVIFVWEWRGIAKAKKDEDAPTNTVQF